MALKGIVLAGSYPQSVLRETVDWFIANESWWRAVLDGSYKSLRFAA